MVQKAAKFESEFVPELPWNSIPGWSGIEFTASIPFREWNRESLFQIPELNWEWNRILE